MVTAMDSARGGTATAEETAPKQNAAWHGTAVVVLLRVVVIAVTLVLWQLLSGVVLPEYAISKPTDVVTALGDYLGSSAGWLDIKTTSLEIMGGFGIGVLLGTVMGLVLGSFRLLGQVLEPLIAAINGIPKIALAPVFLLIFGIGMQSKIAIAVAGVSFVMFYNIYLGLRLRDRELVEIVRVMGGKRHHVLSYVTIPTLAAPFFAALKTSCPLAILGVIGGEFIASANGVGHELFMSSTNLDAPTEFAGLIVLVAMTLILNGVLTALDNYALKRLGLAKRRRTAKA